MRNSNLHKAKKAKNDEFYTQLIDIEKELKNYSQFFENKIIYCNADTSDSNFFKYFYDNFEILKIKKLIISSNDFRSDECIAILKEADIVVTNPPFSLFREFIDVLMTYDKKFLVVGNKNAITYKEVFKHIKENNLWLGCTSPDGFRQPEENEVKQMKGLCLWFTNLDVKKRHDNLELYKTYSSNEYPKYDNYDAINVDKTCDIPKDYTGAMGVPITFLNVYNPDQFEIIGLSASAGYDVNIVGLPFNGVKDARCIVNSKNVYARIFIKNKTL